MSVGFAGVVLPAGVNFSLDADMGKKKTIDQMEEWERFFAIQEHPVEGRCWSKLTIFKVYFVGNNSEQYISQHMTYSMARMFARSYTKQIDKIILSQ